LRNFEQQVFQEKGHTKCIIVVLKASLMQIATTSDKQTIRAFSILEGDLLDHVA
jgi:hypothetical protein